MIPDTVEFGGGITYGDARALATDSEKLNALKRRLYNYLTEQVDAFAYHGNWLYRLSKLRWGKAICTQNRKSAFPIVICSYVGFAGLAEIFFDHVSALGHSRKERQQFIGVLGSAEPRLIHSFNTIEQAAVSNNWPPAVNQPPVDSPAALIYTYSRNKLVHTMQSWGVSLRYDLPDFRLDKGFLHLNPHWFWEQFKKTEANLFSLPPGNQCHSSALIYFQKLIRN